MACECMIHRYSICHVYKGKIYSHSQNQWDALFRGMDKDFYRRNVTTVPSENYVHGMTADELVETLV